MMHAQDGVRISQHGIGLFSTIAVVPRIRGIG